MNWEAIVERIDKEININREIPKTDGGTRKVTKIIGNRIYLRTGVKTKSEKFTTKQMLQYAHSVIQSGKLFTSKDLKIKFPKEYNQGDCVFSMTGGILELLGEAKYVGRGYTSK